ncbi:hypothetical protein ABEF95_003578 [Exophiala dermatitidis]
MPLLDLCRNCASNRGTKDIDISRSYEVLGLPHDTTVDELDETYLQLTLRLSGASGLRNKEESKEQQELLDMAYHNVLARLLKEFREPFKADYSMQQVVNGEDRIQPLSQHDTYMWIPPEAPPSPTNPSGSESSLEDLGEAPGFSMNEIEGDIFDAPDRAVLIHAVNCLGVWGNGIAAQFKKAFPAAYAVYRSHCQQANKPYDLIGTCLLIPPQPKDYVQEMTSKRKKNLCGRNGHSSTVVYKKRHWIACLFTSIGFGEPSISGLNPGKDSRTRILIRTQQALEQLRILLEEFQPSNFNPETSWRTDDDKPGEIWCCKFNSGAFEVDWEDTCARVEEEFVGFERPWTVVERVAKDKHGGQV